jgi:hypothetical protein
MEEMDDKLMSQQEVFFFFFYQNRKIKHKKEEAKIIHQIKNYKNIIVYKQLTNING